jgi:L-arabinose isomerase
LTLELYEQLLPELRSDREQWLRRALLPALSPVADVEFRRAVFRCDEIEAEVQRLEQAGAQALLVVCLTYAPSQVVLPALGRTSLPIVIWNTQELAAVDRAFDDSRMLANHGVHGTQDLANVLLRAGVPFHCVTSLTDEPKGLAELADFFTAAAAVRALRSARLGLMGNPMMGMGDFAVDTTHLVATLGCQWVSLPVQEYNRRAAAAGDDETRRLAGEYRQAYDVDQDVTDADLTDTARAELGLRALLAEQRLDAVSYHFGSLGEDERTVTMPFVAASRLMAEGVGFAGEGDLVGAAGTWLLGRLQGPASFTEIFTTDFAGNGLFLSHMGEMNAAMARPESKIRLAAKPRPLGRIRGRQLVLLVALRPGPATLCALAQGPGARWRLIASRAEIADFGPLPALSVPHAKLVIPHADVRDWLGCYARAGGPHHHALCFGDARRRIRFAAELLEADYCEV